MKKILLILTCLIFTSCLALADYVTKKEKGYRATQPQIIDFITKKMQ